jgi:hypothetical protein
VDKWQYLTKWISEDTWQKQLNDLGDVGWECIGEYPKERTYSPHPPIVGYQCHFKRYVPEGLVMAPPEDFR